MVLIYFFSFIQHHPRLSQSSSLSPFPCAFFFGRRRRLWMASRFNLLFRVGVRTCVPVCGGGWRWTSFPINLNAHTERETETTVGSNANHLSFSFYSFLFWPFCLLSSLPCEMIIYRRDQRAPYFSSSLPSFPAQETPVITIWEMLWNVVCGTGWYTHTHPEHCVINDRVTSSSLTRSHPSWISLSVFVSSTNSKKNFSLIICFLVHLFK